MRAVLADHNAPGDDHSSRPSELVPVPCSSSAEWLSFPDKTGCSRSRNDHLSRQLTGTGVNQGPVVEQMGMQAELPVIAPQTGKST